MSNKTKVLAKYPEAKCVWNADIGLYQMCNIWDGDITGFSAPQAWRNADAMLAARTAQERTGKKSP